MPGRVCEVCGAAFEARTARARFCSNTCTQRSRRATRDRSRIRLAPPLVVPPSMEAALRRDLNDAGLLDTVGGQQALLLVERMGSAEESGASVAALSKELRALLAVLFETATTVEDPLEALRRSRDAKRG